MLSVFVLTLCYLGLFPVDIGKVGRSMPMFLKQIGGKSPRTPEMIVGGSSLNGMGIHIDVLEERIASPCSKIAIDTGTLSECLAILKRYEFVCQKTKIILVDFNTAGTESDRIMNHRKRLRILSIPQTAAEKYFLFLQGNWELFRRPFCELYDGFRVAAHLRNRDNFSFEFLWHEKSYADATVPDREQLKEKWRKIQKEGYPLDRELSLSADTNPIPRETVEVYLDFCKAHEIFVVFNITPTWRGSEWTYCEKYQAYFDELNARPGCMVIHTPNFDSIDPACEDESCFFDSGHMTEYGATVYTNWLVDQMLNSAKVRAHLKANQ